jgi:ribonuclease Z
MDWRNAAVSIGLALAVFAADARDITAIFITHLHSDHIAGLPDMYATAPLGPGGSRRVLMFAANNEIRVAEKDMVQEATPIVSHALPADGGLAYESAGVKVTGFRVEHGRATAYGYTTYSANLVEQAKGAELLIRCVAIGSRRLEQEARDLVRPRYAHLASPETAAMMVRHG